MDKIFCPYCGKTHEVKYEVTLADFPDRTILSYFCRIKNKRIVHIRYKNNTQ